MALSLYQNDRNGCINFVISDQVKFTLLCKQCVGRCGFSQSKVISRGSESKRGLCVLTNTEGDELDVGRFDSGAIYFL